MSISKIGTVLREARKAKKLTLKQVAEQTGVHFTTLSALERGTITELGVRKLVRVAEALGLDLTLRPSGQNYTLDDLAAERAAAGRQTIEPSPLTLRLTPVSKEEKLESKKTQSIATTGSPPTNVNIRVTTENSTNALAAVLNDYNKNTSLDSLGNTVDAFASQQSEYNKLKSLTSAIESAKAFASQQSEYNKLKSLASASESAKAFASQQSEYNKLKSLISASESAKAFASQQNEYNKLKSLISASESAKAFASQQSEYNKLKSLISTSESAKLLAAQQREYDKLKSLSTFDSAVKAFRETDLLTRALGSQKDIANWAGELKEVTNQRKKGA